MPVTDSDRQLMQAALELAAGGLGRVEPNPLVGCVIARDDEIIGRGWHGGFGGPHAEIEALADGNDPQRLRGATAYVTLEPCCHHGKTPPCTEALIDAGVARVVIAMRDPFPRVDGGGIDRLRAAGIKTEVGLLGPEAEALNAPYLKRVRSGMPWVIAKWAMTADGRIATVAGQSQWITGEEARENVHRLRGRVDGIAVGMGTVEADDPLLTARPPGERLACRVVFCRHRLPSLTSNLVRTVASVPTTLVVAPTLGAGATAPYRDAGVDVIACASDDGGAMVREALQEFGRRDWTNLLVEGGGELLASFFEIGQIDECQVYLGGKAFGGRAAPGPIGGVGISAIEQAPRLQLRSVEALENDVLAIYRVADRH